MGKLPSNRATKAYHIEMKRILNNAPKRQPESSKSADKADAHTQAQKFAQAARDLGADQDEGAFQGVLKKLSKPKR